MTMTTVSILLMLASVVTSFDYCTITPEHTLCKYHGVGPACGSSYQRGVSGSEAADIVDAHNQYRRLVATGQEGRGAPGPQPSAADMRQISWDDELAAEAQRWAEQCNFQHDCNDCRKVPRFSVGQNLFITMSSSSAGGSNWREAVRNWYEEVQKFDRRIVPRYQFNSATGHYSQVVWGNTYRVGCGYIHYYQDNWYKKFYVCNYGSAGNYISLPVYTIGNPCSRCPAGTSCSSGYPGLCA